MVPEINLFQMVKFVLISASALGAISVILGAFGAHAFKNILETNHTIDTFQTGVKYHIFHVLVLLFMGLLMTKFESRWFDYASVAFLMGIIVFSGSLYILSISGTTQWGAVTPFGGLFLIVGWLLLLVGVWKAF